MWKKVIDLNEQQTEEWIQSIEPARGKEIDFQEMRVIDVDVLEALRQRKAIDF
jgi:hypothetical protein